MAQVKIKKEKKEFNPEMVNWTGYKRKIFDVTGHLGSVYIPGKHSLVDVLRAISESLSKSYEQQVTVLGQRYGELSDIQVTWTGGFGMIHAKALESEDNFKKRVLYEEKVKFMQGKMQEDRKEKQKEKDLKTYEKLKLKYNLA